MNTKSLLTLLVGITVCIILVSSVESVSDNSDPNHDLESSDDNDVDTRAPGWGKRAPGWGKRAPGWGKRAPGWGKRAPGWGKRAPGWGKRAPGWGKRGENDNEFDEEFNECLDDEDCLKNLIRFISQYNQKK